MRCAPALHESDGRCQSCVRSKKQCHFDALEYHASMPRRRSRPGRKVEGCLNKSSTSLPSDSSSVLVSSTSGETDSFSCQTNTLTPPHGRLYLLNYPAPDVAVDQHGQSSACPSSSDSSSIMSQDRLLKITRCYVSSQELLHPAQ